MSSVQGVGLGDAPAAGGVVAGVEAEVEVGVVGVGVALGEAAAGLPFGPAGDEAEAGALGGLGETNGDGDGLGRGLLLAYSWAAATNESRND